MAKLLFSVGLTFFIGAFVAEIAFILLGLTAVSGSSDALPGWVSVLIIWGCIGLGMLSWVIAAALVVAGYLRNRP